MSGDGIPWRSGAAEFDEVGMSLVKRDIEVLMIALQKIAAATGVNVSGQPLNAAASIPSVDQGVVTVGSGGVGVGGGPTTLAGDVTGPSGANTVEKLLGAALDSSVGSVSGGSQPDLFLWWNKTVARWATFEWFQGSPVVGDLNVYDPAASDANGKMATVSAGTAASVFGNASASAAKPGPIVSSSDNTVLGRRSSILTWAKVARAEQADGSACSVIGRSTNSTGAVADISGAANQVLACTGAPALSFSRTITLGDTSNAGSLTIGNTTSASAIVLDPSLVTTAGKILSVREIDVCEAGVAKKMLVLGSATY